MSRSQDESGGDQLRCQLPDTLIGIGKAGKKVVEQYLSQDWILEEGFAARGNEQNPEGFDAYVIDTATDEQPDDERMVRRLNDRIEAVAEESGRQPEVVQKGVTYINPLDHAQDDLISRAGLTSDATVREIARGASLNAWWLENEDSMLTDGYSEGVLRRRGLSKALFHASQAGGGALEQLPREVGDSVSLIVGIGGGTGSGTFIDIAKQIEREGGTVNLFAIIPGLGEKDRRRANAFAALSELEYLAMRGRNPFQNIVLLPFGPARNLQDRNTFLDGIVQAIVARENTTNDFKEFLNESAEDGPLSYAPFTVAIPQILRYDVGEIQQTEEAITDYREAKREALDYELRLYEHLQEFLIEEWNQEVGRAVAAARDSGQIDNDQFTLSPEEANALHDRLEDLEEWVGDEDRFGYVDNEALETWRDQLDQWISAMEETVDVGPDQEFKEELVTRLPDRVRTLESPETLYEGKEQEQELDRVFRDELRALQMRATLFRAVKLIDEDEVREAINSAINEDRDGWIGAQRLEDRIGTINQEVQEYETNLDVLDDLEEDLRSAMAHHKDQWRGAVADDVSQLISLEEHKTALTSQLEELEQSLVDAFRTINNAHAPEEVPQNLLDFDFDRLNDRLTEVGLEPVDDEAIQVTVERAVDAYQAWYEINDTGLLSRMIGSQEEVKTDYRKYVDEADESYVLIQPTGERGEFDRDFYCEFVAEGEFSGLVDELEERRERLLDGIVRQFEESLTSFDPAEEIAEYRAEWVGDDFDLTWPGDVSGYSEEFADQLAEELDADSASEALDALDADPSGFDDHGVIHQAFEAAFIEPIETKRTAVEADKQDAEAEAELYDELREIVFNHGDSFDDTGPSHPVVDELPSVEDSPYVRKTKSDQSGLRGRDDIADAGIWEDREGEEFQKIKAHFRQFAEKIGQNTDTVGLLERRIELATGTGTDQYSDARSTVYDGHYVGNVYMSRPFPEDDENPSNPVFDTVRETLEDSGLFFREDANGFSQESMPFGGPWDLSMTTFIGGVFLDNLRLAQQVNRGYKVSYEAQRDELSDRVRIRHVHAVDGKDPDICEDNQGAFVYRDRMLDLNDPDDRYELLDSTEEEMVDNLMSNYVTWDRFDSSIDLNP